MTLNLDPEGGPPAPKRPRRLNGRTGHLWLAAGTVLSLFAVHGRWDVAPAAWLSGVFLLRYTRTRRPLAGFGGVWAASAIAAVFWLYESGLPVFGPVLLLCLALSTTLCLPFLVDRLLAPRLAASPVLATLVFPLARVLAEYVNATISPAGNIFGSLAATQHANLPLLQVAAITGSYGVSFLVAWLASVCNGVWQDRSGWRRLVAAFGVTLAVVLAGGGARLLFFAPDGPTVRVAGVSPSAVVLEQRNAVLADFPTLKELAAADPARLRPAFAAVADDLFAASERETRAGARIIAWPEASVGTLADDAPALTGRATAFAREQRVYLVMGVGVLTRTEPYLRNQSVLVDPDGNVTWTYDKAHPIPGMETLIPGDGRVPATDTPFGRLASVICFDLDFPALARQAGRKRVDIMLVPSNDWRGFGRVHTEKATVRAIENGYSVVRPDTNGLSRAIDYQGRALASADFFATHRQVVVADLPIGGARTVYAAVGDLIARASAPALALVTLLVLERPRRRPAPGV
jgi:apolipoprotein N-acyltransferase